MKQKMNQGRLNPLYPKKEKVLTVVGAFFVTTLERVSVLSKNHCPACKVLFLDEESSAEMLCFKSKHEIRNLQGFYRRKSILYPALIKEDKSRGQNVPFGGNSLKPRYKQMKL